MVAEDTGAEDIWIVVQVGVRVEEEDMRTGARTHCCSAYLTFVAVAARTAGVWSWHALPLHGGTCCIRCALLRSTPPTGVKLAHATAGPMQPLRALPRVVPTQRAHQAIHDEAEVGCQRDPAAPNACIAWALGTLVHCNSTRLPHLCRKRCRKTPKACVLQGRRAQRLAARVAVKASRERRAEQARMRLRPVTHRQGGQTLAPALEVRGSSPLTARARPRSAGHAMSCCMPRQPGVSGVGHWSCAALFAARWADRAVANCTHSPVEFIMMQMRREGGQTVVSPGATQAHMTQLVLPQHANSLAITFGGVVRVK